MIELNLHLSKSVHKAQVPESWDELSAAQFLAIADILFTEPDVFMREVRIVRTLCGLQWKELLQVSDELIATEVLPLVRWVIEDCDLTTQLLPAIECSQRYYGPASHLSNLRFTEFDFAERALHAWHGDTSNMELLFQFVATLYRPAKKDYDGELDVDGDLREPFNPNLTARYAADLMKGASPAFAYATVLWYKGCRQFICGQFPEVFQPTTDSTETTEEPAYFGLIRAIAKEGIYGTFADVEQMYLYTALVELVEAAKERRALEEAIEEAKSKSHAA